MNRQLPVPPSSLPPLAAGVEPLPGYVLVEPLGKGGFGVVWKCEVSGGLHKAIKFVGDTKSGGAFQSAMTQELQALQWIKGIRHPFLLSIERIEVIAGTLVLVMELADRNLLDLYTTHVKDRQPGIPRPLLLSLLREVAEVLDLMNFQYGLQHLDIKPHNIFLVGSHAKVGDFGLVAGLPGLATGASCSGAGGITPLYAPPERIRGNVSRTTDQYSLAIVYQQMLTGLTPYRAPTAQQLVQLHLKGTPDLTALPAEDRPVVARALARNPDERFPTCTDFVEALVRGERLPGAATLLGLSSGTSGLVRRPVLPGDTPRPVPAAPASAAPDHATLPPHATRMLAADALTSVPLSFLTGYKLGECLEQTAIGDLWCVTDAHGTERLAHWLLQPLDPSLDLIATLEQLQHPGLLRTEVHVSPTRRLVLLTALPAETLRDRLDACRAEGRPGIPRAELLHYLGPVAEALDWLATAAHLPHLGVSPGGIVLDGDHASLRDAGVLPLIWLAQGKAAAALNVRYAAPETAQVGVGEPASDQYSLALVFAEMLTGLHPRREARGRGPARLDLDLLPARDRTVVAQALADAPAARFGSCVEFLEALVAAGQDSAAVIELPPVVPLDVLSGTATRAPQHVPTWSDLVEALLAQVAAVGEARNVGGAPYRVLPDGTWECQYPIQVLPGVLQLQLEGFRQQWGGRRMPSPSADTHVLHFIVPLPKTSFFQFSNPEGGIEVVIRLLPLGLADSRNREALIHFRAVGGNLPAAWALLEKQGPRLLPSLRTYLHPAPEQRTNQRWPFPYDLRLWLETPEGGWSPVEAVGIDLSRSGVRFAVAEPLVAETLYLEFVDWYQMAGHALRAQVRRRIDADEGCHYGVAFG